MREMCANPHCENPGGEGRKLLRCGRCHGVHYCSTACQRAHWKKGHKAECADAVARQQAAEHCPEKPPTAKAGTEKTSNPGKPKPSPEVKAAAAPSQARVPFSAAEEEKGEHKIGFNTEKRNSLLQLQSALRMMSPEQRDAQARDFGIEPSFFLEMIQHSPEEYIQRLEKLWLADERSRRDTEKSLAPRLDSTGQEVDFGSGEDCGICLDTLRDPRKLPCGHWFCRDCIEGMRQSNAVQDACPVCREPLPHDDPAELFAGAWIRFQKAKRQVERRSQGWTNLPRKLKEEIVQIVAIFEACAGQGDVPAMQTLGAIYEEGMGVVCHNDLSSLLLPRLLASPGPGQELLTIQRIIRKRRSPRRHHVFFVSWHASCEPGRHDHSKVLVGKRRSSGLHQIGVQSRSTMRGSRRPREGADMVRKSCNSRIRRRSCR